RTDVDPELPGDRGRGGALRAAGRVALDGAGQVDESEIGALDLRGLGAFGHQRGDGLASTLQVATQLAARERPEIRPVKILRLEVRLCGEAVLDLDARLPMQPPGVHAVAPRRGEAVLAEAQPEEVAAERPELDEVALVVEPVLEPMEVQRFRDD